MLRHTKIGATIGPASSDPTVVAGLIEAGMNFARLNFSHGTHQSHAEALITLRAAAKAFGEPLAIMQDLRGPRLRLGLLPPEGVVVNEGQVVAFNTDAVSFSENEVPVDWPGLAAQLKVGERLLIDDGRIEAKIIKLDQVHIFAEIIGAGTIFSRKGLNFPDSTINIPALTDKDKQDVRWGVEHGVDFVALSFVQSARDLLDLRWVINEVATEGGESPAPPIGLIAKIECHAAVKNLEEILGVADGLMVARGDLGLELPAAEVPLMQKKIIDASRRAGKPVMVATQLLDSMQHNRRPTRAEVSDVANAVIDHTDALLLTNETAVGEFPVEAVATMHDIALATERSSYDNTARPTVHKKQVSTEVAISEFSRILAEEVHAKLILAGSLTGETGRLISQVRPELPILVATSHARTAHQLNISWGVKPFILLPCNSIEEFVERSLLYIKERKLGKAGDKIIVVAGEPVGQAGNVNLVEVREVK